MGNLTRREMLFTGLGAAAFLGACSAPQQSPDSAPSTGSDAAPTPAIATTGLVINADGLVDRACFLGVDEKVELANGSAAVAINFDNGATTPSLNTVLAAVTEALPMYGSIGRGKGQKSGISTQRFTDARQVVLDFFGAPADTYSCVFTGTATDALNKLAGGLTNGGTVDGCTGDGGTIGNKSVVLTTRSEHHANDLTWRAYAEMRYVEVDELGRLKMDDFAAQLADGKVNVVSVQAASNVTGYVHDVHAIAKLAHEAGAMMVVDGAQIAAHRAFSMKGETEIEDIDFFVCSAHKMYAPFGGGCIVGRTTMLNAHLPRYRGGGMVDVVLDDDATWLEAPELWEAGSPNYLGQIALATTMDAFTQVGFDAVAAHEQILLGKAVEGLRAIPGVTVYADSDKIDDRVGVLTFNVDNVGAADVAQRLADEWAIAVRQGEFCAHPLCHRLMGYTDDDIRAAMQQPDFSAPAMVRVSFGMYNTEAEVDTLIEAVTAIAKG